MSLIDQCSILDVCLLLHFYFAYFDSSINKNTFDLFVRCGIPLTSAQYDSNHQIIRYLCLILLKIIMGRYELYESSFAQYFRKEESMYQVWGWDV